MKGCGELLPGLHLFYAGKESFDTFFFFNLLILRCLSAELHSFGFGMYAMEFHSDLSKPGWLEKSNTGIYFKYKQEIGK